MGLENSYVAGTIASTVLHAASAAVGNGTPMDIEGIGSIILQVAGPFAGAVVFEATVDDVNWTAVLGTDMNTGLDTTFVDGPGIFAFQCGGLKKIRARIDSYFSGIISVVGTASTDAVNVNIGNTPVNVAVSNDSLNVAVSNDSLNVAVSNDSLNVAVSNDSLNVAVMGGAIIAAGKKTDADITDRVITTTGFKNISIINDGPAELILAVDESALIGAKKIYVGDAEAYTENIAGSTLHYTIANDSCTFRYVFI